MDSTAICTIHEESKSNAVKVKKQFVKNINDSESFDVTNRFSKIYFYKKKVFKLNKFLMFTFKQIIELERKEIKSNVYCLHLVV